MDSMHPWRRRGKTSGGRRLAFGAVFALIGCGREAADGDRWVALPDLQDARQSHMAFALSDGRAVVVGGEGPDATVLTGCEVLEDSRWSECPPLPVGLVASFAATLPGDVLFVAGGFAAPGLTGLSDRAFVARADDGLVWTELDARLPLPLGIEHDETQGTIVLADGEVLLLGNHALDFDAGESFVAADLGLVFRYPSGHPEEGEFDFTRDLGAEPIAIGSGSSTGGAVEPDARGLARLRGSGFLPEFEGQPLTLTGSGAGNDSPDGRPFFVYEVVSADELLFWNPEAQDEPSFTGTWAVGGRRPATPSPRRYGVTPVQIGRRVVRVGGVADLFQPARADWDVYDADTGRWTVYDAPHQLIPAVPGSTLLVGSGGRIGPDHQIARMTFDATTAGPEHLAGWLTLDGAANEGNDGTFHIVAVGAEGHTLRYANAAAVDESFAGDWEIRDGEDPIDALASGRDRAVAVALPDGTLLVAGGLTSFSHAPLVMRRSGFVLDPSDPDDPWSPSGSMVERRYYAKPFPLPGGRFGVALGGDSSEVPPPDADPCDALGYASAEVFDPADGTWSLGPSAPTERVAIDGGVCRLPVTENGFGRVTPLADGTVLFTGGNAIREPEGTPMAATLLYVPAGREDDP